MSLWNCVLTMCALAAGSGACAASAATPATPANSTPTLASPALQGPIWLGDLDSMQQRRLVRILVVYSKTFYFIDKAQQHGLTYAAGVELEKALKWFNNVELVVAKEVGREPVQYVSNIFEYYVAYKLVVERARDREVAKQKGAPAGATAGADLE